MRKLTVLAILSVALLLLLCGCNDTPDTPDKTPTASVTDAATTEPPIPEATPLVISENGVSQYSVVRADECDSITVLAASKLCQAFYNAGVELKITTDFDRFPVSEHEIIIGETTREALDGVSFNREIIGEGGFLIEVVGNRIYLIGGDAEGNTAAVDYFLANYVEKDVKNVSLPENYRYGSSPGRCLSALTVNGSDISEFAVVCEDETDRRQTAAAEKFVGTVFKSCSVYLNRTAAEGQKTVIIKAPTASDCSAVFSLSVVDGNIVIVADERAGLARGIARFYEEVIELGGNRSFNMANGYEYKKNFGKVVTYEDFGAKGDGVTDDTSAIKAAHEYANANNLPVMAKESAVYYIGKAANRIEVQTDTDWGDAEIIIDDSDVENIGVETFRVSSKQSGYSLAGQVTTLKAGQKNIGITLQSDCLVTANNKNVKMYIRYGANANTGNEQTDTFRVDKNGNVDPSTPILWDFDEITSISATPIDETPLTIRGGRFTTIANPGGGSGYYYRGIRIYRSNVHVSGLRHYITGEGTKGQPYYGILIFYGCADCTVTDCLFTGHKTYKNNEGVNMGTYDITVTSSVNVTMTHCRQTNDINDTKYWGVFASNNSKNLVYDDCYFSRFDAHRGVANVTIKNSKLGHQGINLIGSGTALIENTTVYSNNFVNLRSDYGSTWEGELIIRNCVFVPGNGKATTTTTVINGSNKESHNFGYTCYLPKTVTIDGLTIRDSGINAVPVLFADFNSSHTSDSYSPEYPMVITETVKLKGIVIESERELTVCKNTYLFSKTVITKE